MYNMIHKKVHRKRAPRRPRKPTRKPQQQQVVVLNKRSDKPVRFVKTILSDFTGGIPSLVGTGTYVTGANSVSIGNVPDFGSIAQLFNRYKINKIHLTVRWKETLTTGSLSVGRAPTMWIRYNYDTNLALGSIPTKVQEGNNWRQISFTPDSTQHTYTFIPFTVAPVYLSQIATGYELQKKKYIDSAYQYVPHYGIMYYVDSLAVGQSISFDVTYDFSVKYIQ